MKKIISVLSILLFISACGGGKGTLNPTELIEGYSLKELGNFPISYARSVEVVDNGNTVFVGTSFLTAVNASETQNMFSISNLGGEDFLQLEANQDESLLFAVDYGSFSIFNIENRFSISLMSTISSRGASSFSVSKDEKIVAVNDLDGVKLIDIEDKENINIVSEFPDSVQSSVVSKDGNILYLVEPVEPQFLETDYVLNLYDISNPSLPVLIGELGGLPSHSYKMKLTNAGDKLFIYTFDQLVALDISDVNNIQDVFYFDDFGFDTIGSKISISDDDKILFVSAGDTLKVVDISNNNNIRVIGTRDGFSHLGTVSEFGNHVYVADGGNGMWVLER